MLNRLFIAAALVTSGPLIGSAVSSATDITIGQAQAADFTGRIKNVRIKKRRTGSGFKVVTRTEGAEAGSVAGGTVAIRSAENGELLDTLDLGSTKGATVSGRSADAVDPEVPSQTEATLDLYINLEYTTFEDEDAADEGAPEEGAPDDGITTIAIPVEFTALASGGFAGEGVSADGWKVRARISANGRLRTVLMHENQAWNGDGVEAMQLRIGDAAYPIEETRVRQRRVATTDVDLDGAGLLEVSTTLVDAAGAVISTRTEIVDATPEPAAPALSKITARQTGGGDAKLVTITQGGGLSLAVELTDNATGEAVISTVDETPISTVRVYEHTGLEFDPGEDPADYVYLMLIDMLDSNGDPVGEQYEVELVLPKLVEGEATLSTAPFGDGLGQVVVARDAEGFTFSVGVRNTTEVDAVNLIFEEPYEGPAPLETEINATSAGQLNKWVQKGETALPANFTVNTVMTNADGAVVAGRLRRARGRGRWRGMARGRRSPRRGCSSRISRCSKSSGLGSAGRAQQSAHPEAPHRSAHPDSAHRGAHPDSAHRSTHAARSTHRRSSRP